MNITDVDWKLVDCGQVVLVFKCIHSHGYTFHNLDVFFFVTLVGVCINEGYPIRQLHL